MFLKTNLFIGGYDKRMILNRGVGVTKGFNGCVTGVSFEKVIIFANKIQRRILSGILQLEVGGRSHDMIADIKDSANVQNCGQSYQPIVSL